MSWLALLLASALPSLIALAGYIASQSSFPEPLSREEEAECLARLQEGDSEARATLIEHNLRLVAHVVKKFETASDDTEDLISIGTIGLIKAINSFNPNRGTRLSTYAARCIENEILMHLRSTKKTRGERYLQDPIGYDGEGNEITLMDVMACDEKGVGEQVREIFLKDRLQDCLGHLGERERSVVEMRYGLRDGVRQTQREIARQLGISRSYVSRIEKRAVNKLTAVMGD